AAYWFHPLVWMAAHRLRIESERACDDLVLQSGSRATEYAVHLLDVARSLRSSPRLSAAAVPMARTSQLEGRLRAILEADRGGRGPARWLVAACLAAVLGASATLAAVRLVAREVAGRVVHGLVVGHDGKPVEGAAVAVFVSRPSLRHFMEFPMTA